MSRNSIFCGWKHEDRPSSQIPVEDRTINQKNPPLKLHKFKEKRRASVKQKKNQSKRVQNLKKRVALAKIQPLPGRFPQNFAPCLYFNLEKLKIFQNCDPKLYHNLPALPTFKNCKMRTLLAPHIKLSTQIYDSIAPDLILLIKKLNDQTNSIQLCRVPAIKRSLHMSIKKPELKQSWIAPQQNIKTEKPVIKFEWSTKNPAPQNICPLEIKSFSAHKPPGKKYVPCKML